MSLLTKKEPIFTSGDDVTAHQAHIVCVVRYTRFIHIINAVCVRIACRTTMAKSMHMLPEEKILM